MNRSNAPVFIVGSPRSGTTWLYHILVSSGLFANYRAETHFFDLFLPRFGPPTRSANRRRLTEAWLGSNYHDRTGVDPVRLRERLMERGVTAGAFLGEIMSATAEACGVGRWAEATPAHALHMERIARELPSASFIHVVRDGRDVALSLASRGWTRPSRTGLDPLLICAWRWEYIVMRARASSAVLGERVLEVRYEDLVDDPGAVLETVGEHVRARLDMAEIRHRAVGSVSRPNTSFGDAGMNSGPAGRWRVALSGPQLAGVEATIGHTLERLGYGLASPSNPPSITLRLRRALFHIVSDAKELTKRKTRLGRFLVDPAAAAPPPGPID